MSDTIKVHPLGDAEAIALLVNNVWRGQYPDDPLLPIWSPDFFRWQFLETPKGHPAICLGGFVEDRLVGVYCGDIWTVRFGQQRDRVTLLYCVSVLRDRQRHRVSSALLEAMRAWSAEEGAHHFFGFVNPEGAGKVGRRYWTTRFGYGHQFLPGPRQWQYRPDRIAGASQHSAGCVGRDAVTMTIRAHLDSLCDNDRLSFEWSDGRLAHQIQFSELAQAEVVTDGSNIGACSFYRLPAHGGGSVGFVDFLAASNGDPDLIQGALENAVVAMRNHDCRRIFVLGPPVHSEDLLVSVGFVPCFPSYTPLIVSWDADFSLPSNLAAQAAVYR